MGTHSEITLSTPSSARAGSTVTLKALIHNKSQLARSFTVYNGKTQYGKLTFGDYYNVLNPNYIGTWKDTFLVPNVSARTLIKVEAESWTVNEKNQWVFDDKTYSYITVEAITVPLPSAPVVVLLATANATILSTKDTIVPPVTPTIFLLDTKFWQITSGEGEGIGFDIHILDTEVAVIYFDSGAPLPPPGEGPIPEPEEPKEGDALGVPKWLWITAGVILLSLLALIVIAKVRTR